MNKTPPMTDTGGSRDRATGTESGLSEAVDLLSDVMRAIAATAGDNASDGQTALSYIGRLPEDEVAAVSQVQFAGLVNRVMASVPKPRVPKPANLSLGTPGVT